MDNSLNNILSGCFAGVVQTLSGHPFDTIKVWHIKHAQSHDKSIMRSIKTMHKQGGYKQFYRGIVPPMYSSVLSNMKIYFLYNFFRRKQQFNPYMAGVNTGVVLSFVEAPTDMIKSKMQISNKKLKYLKVIKELGVRGVFRGTSATIVRNVPAVGGYFWGYENVKSKFMSPMLGSFFGGMAAGFMCWGPTYPLDYIKTRIQTSTKKLTMLDIIRTTKFTEYWKGFTPCVLRAVAINPFVFIAYETGMKYLQ